MAEKRLPGLGAPLGADPGPIALEHHALMNHLARVLDVAFNGENCPADKRRVGFFLTAFNFNEGQGRFNYISNADPLDVRAMLHDVLARLEARLSPPGRA